MRDSRLSPSSAVALLALVVATSGTAVAVTVSRTSIVDAKHPARSAKIDTTGALKVTVPQTVGTRPLPPSRPMKLYATVSNFYKNGSVYQKILPATDATVAVTRLRTPTRMRGRSSSTTRRCRRAAPVSPSPPVIASWST